MLLLETLGAYRVHSKNNFAAPGVLSFEVGGGDMTKHPTMGMHAELALAVMKSRPQAFLLNLAPWQLASVKLALEKWFAMAPPETVTI
jgi:hypothetical protein